ncbi:MAG: spore coat associated protein CotJA [Lachnospira sp.]
MNYSNQREQALAMCYVPWQRWSKLYKPCEALRRGTLFPCLDKPYKGGRS